MKMNPPGKGSLYDFEIPASYKVSILEPALQPKSLPAFLGKAVTETEMVIAALEQPIGMGRLDTLVKPSLKVAIVVDDITRPTPSRLILEPILRLLKQSGIRDQNIRIIFANGSHRRHSTAEKEKLLGKAILSRYRVAEHDAHDRSRLQLLGHTSRGTPVLINQIVADAELRILTGLIKPHSQAAYSGGGKSILPGVAGIETILRDHNFSAVKLAKLGSLADNPIRSDIEEAAQMVGPSFIVNVVLNPQKRIVAAVAGDMIKAHRAGCEILDSMCRYTVNKRVDIGIALCPEPADINFYQAIGGIVPFVKTEPPVLAKRGTIILVAECREGMGHPIFARYDAGRLKAVAENGVFDAPFEEGQWSVQILAECLEYANIIVVAGDKNRAELESLGLLFASTVQEAFNRAMAMARGTTADPEILLLPDAPYTIVDLRME